MQKLTRQNRFKNYGDFSTLPAQPPLRVKQGESFIIETTDTGDIGIYSEKDIHKPCGPMAWNPSTGPVFVEGIQANDVIAIHIEDLQVVGHCKIDIGPESLLPPEHIKPRTDFIKIENGYAHFAGNLKAPIKPMLGCIGVVPATPSPDPWHHGGNMDLPDICSGSILHIRSQRNGAWFCCGDGHALQGDGEVNGYALEVSLDAKISIEKSPFQQLKTLLIETQAAYITVGIAHHFEEAIRSAVENMAAFFAEHESVDLLDAYQFVSHVGDVRVGPVWDALQQKRWRGGLPTPACFQVSKSLFQN